MPPMPPVPGVCKLLIGGFVDNTQVQNWANVLHLQYSGTPPTQGNLSSLSFTIQSSWTTNMAPECPSPTTLTTIQLTDLSSATAAQNEMPVLIPGTRGDDSGPANAALLISYPVPARWRGGHPRSYLYVGGVADYQGAAEWSNAFMLEAKNHWQSFVDGFIPSTIGATSFTGICVVRFHGKFLPNGGPPHYVLDTPLVYPLDVNNCTASLEIASQRGRIGRAKRNKAGATP